VKWWIQVNQFQRTFRKKLKEAKAFKIQLLSNTIMSPPRDKVLVVVGCGPGIGVPTAALFAAHSFNKIALIARKPSVSKIIVLRS
jgi:hypothetical protein